MSNFEFRKGLNQHKDQGSSLLNRVFDKLIYRIIIGSVIGAIVGYFYWEYIGCNSGGCPLTSNPYKTVILFIILGGFLAK